MIIIGAGLSGLSTAHFLKKMRPGARIVILEKADKAGGTIQTFQKDGFTAEWGAHGFLNNCDETNELLADLNLTGKAFKAPLKNFARYICLNGRLKRLPQTPPNVILGSFMSLPAKLRALCDIWIKPKPKEQSIADWAQHRFGSSVLPFVDAAATGTYAGDIDQLSIDAVMPRLREIEKQYGSVIRGMMKLKGRTHRSAPTKQLPSMLNFSNGLNELIDTLARDKDVRFNNEINKIEQTADMWRVTTDKETFTAQNLIVATQINAALKLLSTIDTPPLPKIPEAKLVNVVLGFDAGVKIPHAFGFLTPKKENRFVLGVMFSSTMFPNRSPHDMVLLECLVGGTRNPERLEMADDQLVDNVLVDLKDLMNISTEPLFTQVLRPANGIPQLNVGHSKLWDWKEKLLTNHPNLAITGFGWHGIGMNDMVKEAKKTAERVAGESTNTQNKIKMVYF